MNGQDAQYLKLLSIFHYVVGGLAFLCGCLFIFHVVIGIAALSGGDTIWGQFEGPPPIFFGLMFLIMGGGAMIMMWTVGTLLLVAAGYLKQRTHYKFCLVAAAVACLFQPFGMILGIFTIIVLCRHSVKVAFGAAEPAAPPPAPPAGRAYT